MQNHKIWIFQSVRDFTSEELHNIEVLLSGFLKNWQTHGSDLTSGFSILENRFIKVFVDENIQSASGCSIDSLTRLIKKIDEEYKLELLNRMYVSYLSTNEIHTVKINEFKTLIQQGKIQPTDYFYDVSVSTENEFQQRFKSLVKDRFSY